MLTNPLQYLKGRNTAYAAIANSAGAVYCGALFQIAQSVTEGMPVDNAAMTARSTALAANTDVVAAAPDAWPNPIKNAAKVLSVQRLAAETAMNRPSLMQSMLSSLWKVRLKSPNRKLMIKPEKQLRRKYHRPSKVNGAIAATNFFLCVYT